MKDLGLLVTYCAMRNQGHECVSSDSKPEGYRWIWRSQLEDYGPALTVNEYIRLVESRAAIAKADGKE